MPALSQVRFLKSKAKATEDICPVLLEMEPAPTPQLAAGRPAAAAHGRAPRHVESNPQAQSRGRIAGRISPMLEAVHGTRGIPLLFIMGGARMNSPVGAG